MHAIRIARGFTGRDKIIKMEGGYHGVHDSVLVSMKPSLDLVGDPDRPNQVPASGGVPLDTVKNTLVAQFNDLKVVNRLFKENPGQIAAIIIEPIMMNIGICMPEPGYLEGLREICTREGALLIFDEVKTGAKLGRGGACEYFNIKADIVTLAKSIGGGFPLAAFAASKQIMDVIAQQKVFHAGTYATNPLVMAAGLATLREVLTPAGYAHIAKVSDALVAGYKQIVQKTGIEAYVESAGSNGAMLLYRHKIRNYRDWHAVDTNLWRLYWFGMLNRGVMAQPYWWDEQWTISVAHSMADIDQHLSAFEQVAPALAQAQQETMATAAR
jgi:glutamate-1-semialdehyde 2,1-aminomutase